MIASPASCHRRVTSLPLPTFPPERPFPGSVISSRGALIVPSHVSPPAKPLAHIAPAPGSPPSKSGVFYFVAMPRRFGRRHRHPSRRTFQKPPEKLPASPSPRLGLTFQATPACYSGVFAPVSILWFRWRGVPSSPTEMDWTIGVGLGPTQIPKNPKSHSWSIWGETDFRSFWPCHHTDEKDGSFDQGIQAPRTGPAPFVYACPKRSQPDFTRCRNNRGV